MKSSTNIAVRGNEHSYRGDDLRKMSLRQLLQIMNLVIINCESALLTAGPEEIGCQLKNAKKYYATMLQHAWRHSLTVGDIHALELGSARLEATICNLEDRYAARKGRR